MTSFRTGNVYVNTVAGSDSANGTSRTTPVATLTKALQLLGGAGGTIVVYAPYDTPLREVAAYDGAGNVTIVSAHVGMRWHHFGAVQHTSGWGSVGGGVYSKALSGYPTALNNVLVRSSTDADGFWVRLTANTSTPTTPAAGQFGWSSGTLYVRLSGDADPNTATTEVSKFDYCFFTNGTGVVTIQEAAFWVGNRACVGVGSAATSGKLVVEDSSGYYGGDLGCFATRGDAVYLTANRVKARRAINDGFNVHGATGAPVLMTLTDCDSGYNLDEAASPHDDTRLVIVGGRYHHSVQGGMTAVDRSDVRISGQAQFDNNGVGFGAVDIYDATVTGSIDGAVMTNNAGSGIKVKAGAAFTLGSYTSSSNGQADNLAA